MIGYGLVDTSVESIDRRSDDVLVLGVKTTENDLVGALGNAAETASVLRYDPNSDHYPWYKMVNFCILRGYFNTSIFHVGNTTTNVAICNNSNQNSFSTLLIIPNQWA